MIRPEEMFNDKTPSLDTGMVKWQTAEKLFSIKANTLKKNVFLLTNAL